MLTVLEFLSKYWHIVLGFLALSFLSFLLVMGISSSGKTDYCTVETVGSNYGVNLFKVEQHVPWRPNRPVGVFFSLDEALLAAEMANCTVK